MLNNGYRFVSNSKLVWSKSNAAESLLLSFNRVLGYKAIMPLAHADQYNISYRLSTIMRQAGTWFYCAFVKEGKEKEGEGMNKAAFANLTKHQSRINRSSLIMKDWYYGLSYVDIRESLIPRRYANRFNVSQGHLLSSTAHLIRSFQSLLWKIKLKLSLFLFH